MTLAAFESKEEEEQNREDEKKTQRRLGRGKTGKTGGMENGMGK